MRYINKLPYSEDEKRVAKFFNEMGLGGGDDPIGALIASHQMLSHQRNLLRAKMQEVQRTFFDVLSEL